jgi:DNA primase
MRIPDSKIDEVRDASDIVDVISAVVPLKKRGKNYLGLCPFHQEKTPSFTVSADKQMYHCFGCGVGGNVFTFVMEHEKVSFVEAVRTLAERAGISLPTEGGGDAGQATETEALYAVCRRAALYYHDNLVHTVEGRLALEYFHHRGFSDETIRTFGLGYSMNGWDGLLRYGQKEGIETGLLEKAGLVLRREDGSGYYDRFRGRAMFPIFTPSGRVIAFGARKLREDDPLGKYINSPETPVYDKSRSLYGLFQSKDAIREEELAVLVEGYADLISLYQADVRNTVASSGTALTIEQIQLLGRYTRNIVLVYDADSAGSKATVRGVDLIIEQGLDVRVVELPQGEDPDSFVRKNGGDAFRALVRNSMSFLDFKAGVYKSQGLLETPEGKAKAVAGIVETIAKMSDEVKRQFFIKDLSARYDIYEIDLHRALRKLLKSGRERDRNAFAPPAPSGTPDDRIPSSSAGTDEEKMPVAERDLVKILLATDRNMLRYVLRYLTPDMITDQRARRIVDYMAAKADAGEDWEPASLPEDFADDTGIQHFVSRLVSSRYTLPREWKDFSEAHSISYAQDCIVRIAAAETDRRIRENYLALLSAQKQGEDMEPFERRNIELQRRKKELLSKEIFAPPSPAGDAGAAVPSAGQGTSEEDGTR